MISGEKEFTPKKSVSYVILKSQLFAFISKLYTKIHNFNKMDHKTINTQKKYLLPFFFLNFTQKSVKMQPKKGFTTKHHMFGATNLRQPRKFYTHAVCDG